MASNQTSTDEVPDMIQCPICLEQYEIPRALPCLHTFCEKCLVDWVKHKSVMNTLTIGSHRCFPCPVCKDDVSIPPEGIKGFRHNFYVANVIEPNSPCKKQPSRNSSEDDLDQNIACNRCEEIGVSMICLKCNTWLCPLCCDDHKRVKGTKGHILVTNANLSDVNINEEITDEHLSICDENGHGKTCNIYCTVCKTLICEECQKEKHDSHGVISIISKLEEVRDQLLDCLGRLQKRTEVLQRQQKSLAAAKKDLILQGHKTVKDFDKSFAAIQKKMQTMRNNLQKNLKKHITEQVITLDERITGISNKLAIEQSVEEEMKIVLQSGSKKNLLTHTSMLSEQGEHCLSTHLINLDNTITTSSPSWIPCEADLFDQLLVKLLGGCTYTGVDVNLNKKVKSKKAKRSHSSSSRNKENKEVDDKIQLDQLEQLTDDSNNTANQLCEIIRDFDPYGPTDQASQQSETMFQQQTESTVDGMAVTEDMNAHYDYYQGQYTLEGEGSFDTESPPSDLDGEQVTNGTSVVDMQSPPPVGPFYEGGQESMAPYWWPPPPPSHFHGPPGAPPHWAGPGRGRGRMRHGMHPPGFRHHRPPHHHHHPPQFYGSPSRRPGLHPMQRHRHGSPHSES